MKYLSDVIKGSQSRDLVLDLRHIEESDVSDRVGELLYFFKHLGKLNDFKNIILTSSGIPQNGSDLVSVSRTVKKARPEWNLWQNLLKGTGEHKVADSVIDKLVYGDYSVISPEYSDIDISPELFPSIITPRIIYTSIDELVATRGASIKQHGNKQYFALAQKVTSEKIYKGKKFSYGDRSD